jgi:Mn-dependent DtxR family transcriptional regulator
MSIEQIIKTQVVKAIKETLLPEIKEVIRDIIYETENTKTYTMNKASKMIGCSPNHVAKLVKDGVLQKTPDGRITGREINKYLEGINETNQ